MANVYRIGVSIAMSSNSTAVLGVMAKQLLGIHGTVGNLQKGFSRLKLAIGGAVSIAAGAALIGGVVKLAKAAEELSREQGKMAAAGIANRDIARATASAWSISANVMGTRVADNLKAIAHLRASFGDLGEAINIAPAYQRSSVALGAITGKDGEGEAFKLAQAIHLSGAATDPLTKRLRQDLFGQQMNLYTAMVAAGGGKINAGDLLQFQKQSGSYGGNLSNTGRIDLIGLIQSMGGQRAGTMVSTTNRALKDGVIQKASLAQLEKIGLIDPRMVITSGNGGHGNGASPGGGVQFKPGALTNEQQFRSDPMGWVWGTLVPKLKAAGITSTDDQVNWVQHAKLTANVTRFLAEGIRNQGVDSQEARNVRQASAADQYRSVMGRDLGANIKAFGDSWHNLMTALGAPLIKPAIAGIQNITHAVQAVTKWAVANPKAVETVAKAAVFLGAVLIGFGVVAVGVAAFGAVAAAGTVGVVIAAIGGIIAGLTALVVFNWDAVTKVFSTITKTIGGFFNWLIHGDGGASAKAASAALQSNVGAAGQGFGSSAGFRAPPKAANQNKPGDVYLDGKKVGRIIGPHLAANGAQGGSSGFDPTMAPAFPGMGYGGGM